MILRNRRVLTADWGWRVDAEDITHVRMTFSAVIPMSELRDVKDVRAHLRGLRRKLRML